MRARWRPGDDRPRTSEPTDLFLKALRLGGTSYTPETLAQLGALYEQAIAIDPTFARAYSGLAFIHRSNKAPKPGRSSIRSDPDTAASLNHSITSIPARFA
jgi:hypothetical protein